MDPNAPISEPVDQRAPEEVVTDAGYQGGDHPETGEPASRRRRRASLPEAHRPGGVGAVSYRAIRRNHDVEQEVAHDDRGHHAPKISAQIARDTIPRMAHSGAAFCTIAEPVAEALRAGRPVVALESTLITHGFAYPRNREVALACEAEVRAASAVPATVAINKGRILIGLDEEQIETLATTRGAMKASRGTLAAALSSGGWASTTVSATMIAAHAADIALFATGGIGGVHRGALASSSAADPPSFDISADLIELARTPVIVVCAGPKAILDVR